ncbi:MAG: regulatory protein RecX [Elusimicrobiota bacterium]
MNDSERKEEAMKKAFRYLKYRERSKYEVEKKLLNEGFEKDIVENIIEELLEKNIVNDKRFTRMYVEDSLNIKQKGPYRIDKELRKFGIEDHLITDTLKEFQNQFLETLRSIVENYTTHRVFDKRELLKLKKRLYRKGFYIEDIEREFKRQELE